MAPTSFQFHVENGVGTIMLDRPERMNALTFQVYAELRDLMLALRDDDSVKVVIITGAGRAFCTGGDVGDIIGKLFERDAPGLLEFTRMTCDLIRNMRALPKPIIAALNGTVAGAGAAIALASDLRIAAPTARIAFLFTRVGLSGADMGACYLLPRVVGAARATEILMTGDFISADQALAWGLYNRVVDADNLHDESRALAHKLAAGPAFGIMMTKELINRGMGIDLHTALRTEEEVQALCMLHPDFREAYDAWVEKRQPRYKPNHR